MIKKLIIAMLAFTLVFAAGCGKKDKQAADDTQTQQQEQEQQQQQEQQNDNTEVEKEKEEAAEIDVSDVTGEELDNLVETFNSETASAEEKEAARLKLEAIFKQAEQNHQ